MWQQPEQLCGVPLHICIRKVIAHLHKEAELLLLYGSNKLGVVLLAKAYCTSPDLSLWISIQRAGTRKVQRPSVRPSLFGFYGAFWLH